MRKLAFVKLHEAYQQPGADGLSTLGKCLANTTTLQKGIELYLTDTGIEAQYKGKCFFIPLANVAGCTFEKVEVVTPKPKAVS